MLIYVTFLFLTLFLNDIICYHIKNLIPFFSAVLVQKYFGRIVCSVLSLCVNLSEYFDMFNLLKGD